MTLELRCRPLLMRETCAKDNDQCSRQLPGVLCRAKLSMVSQVLHPLSSSMLDLLWHSLSLPVGAPCTVTLDLSHPPVMGLHVSQHEVRVLAWTERCKMQTEAQYTRRLQRRAQTPTSLSCHSPLPLTLMTLLCQTTDAVYPSNTK